MSFEKTMHKSVRACFLSLIDGLLDPGVRQRDRRSHGLRHAVVSTDCRSGPAEILENGRYGRLVPVGDDETLAQAIGESFSANHDPDALRARAADFSPERVAEQYLRVLSC